MTTSATPPSEPASEPPAQPTMLQRTAQQFLRLRMGHEAMMLQDAQAVLAQNRQASQATQRQFDNNMPASEEMGSIHIGDILHAAPPAGAVPSPAAGSSWATKGAMLGALLLASGGLGAAVPWIYGALTKPAPAATADDVDTRYELHIVE